VRDESIARKLDPGRTMQAASPRHRLPYLREGLVAIVLAGVTVATFLPALGCGFVNFDDPDYVTQNRHVTSGLSAEGTRWAFTTFTNGNWHPLTWLSLQLDASLWWPDPRGFHLTSVLVHAVNAALLFLTLRMMTGTVWRSAAVALLFAIHPLRVESVAWISERKDVLSAWFGLLALLAYVVYLRRPSVVRYLGILVTFALSLLCKPMLITLPCLLLVLDWWPLDRVRRAADWRRLVTEKLPLFVLVVLSAAVAYQAQAERSAVATLEQFPLKVRIENGAVSYVTYIGKTAWPVDLAVYYPHPIYRPAAREGQAVAFAAFAGALFLLSTCTVVAIRMRRRAPYLLAGWLWYFGTLVPVIGILQVGSQAYADRYSYFPQIGLLLALCWGVTDLAGRRAGWTLAAAAALAVALALVTRAQLGVWKDSVTLWQHALQATFSTATAEMNLGTALEERKDLSGAAEHYRKAIEDEPNSVGAHISMGNIFFRRNQLKEAAQEWKTANKLAPNQPEILFNLGRIESSRGAFGPADAYFLEALTLRPNYSEARVGLGLSLLFQGKGEQSLFQLREAERLDPESAVVHSAFGMVLEQRGDLAGAARHFESAVRFAPDQKAYRDNLERVRRALGRPGSAGQPPDGSRVPGR
jgi:Flp pilus assembly protein TadD